MAGYIGSKASVVSSGAERKKTFAITTTTTVLTGLSYTPTFVHLFHNGVRLVDGTDYTATNGSDITLTSAAESGDEVVVISYATFQVADAYTKAEADAGFVSDPNGAVTVDGSGNVGIGTASPTARVTIDGGTSGDQLRLGNDPHYYKIGRNSAQGPLEFYGTQTGVTGYAFGGVDGTRMRIDPAGRVTMPYQPAFAVWGDTGTFVGLSVAGIVQTNVGGHFNNTNGRFTAPVAGNYMFTFSLTTGDTQSHFIDIALNGSVNSGAIGGLHLHYGTVYQNGSLTTIYPLNAGDFVEAKRRGTGYSVYKATFAGFLVG